MFSRRSFLSSVIGLAAAPAVVRASSLMKVVTPVADGHFITMYGYRFGVHEQEQMEGRILRPSPGVVQSWSDALYREANRKPLITSASSVVRGNMLVTKSSDGRYYSKFVKGR